MNNIKNNTTMELHYILDYAMRDKENASYGTGYEIDGRKYDRYMSNEGWKRYLAEMSEDHRNQYKDGDGGELKEGQCPPKMACYGSSSRIIYTCLREVGDIKFEHQLPTRVGSRPANLDAYRHTDSTDIFIEAKCREIYVHNKVKASIKYCKVYKHINDNLNDFSFDKEFVHNKKGEVNKDNYNYKFYYSNKHIVHFDIKQLISHFLGIAAGVLEGVIKDNIRFVYFIYNPTELNNKELSNIYSKTIEEINTINTSELFKAVFDFQKKKLKIEKEMPIFEFVLADQNDIKGKL